MSDLTKIMFVMRKAPYGTRYSVGGLEVALIMGAYEQDISLLFLEDGVYAIKKGMDTSALGIKNFSPTFRVLDGYDINKLYVDRQSMEERGLTEEDLVVDVIVVDREKIAELMDEQDVLFPY